MGIDWSRMRLSGDVDAEQMAAARAGAMTTLAVAVDGLLDQRGAGVPLVERLGWASKEAAARAYTAGNADAEQADLLRTEAEASGDTPEALVALILGQAAAHSALLAKVTGVRRKLARAVEQTHDVAAVQAALALALDALIDVGGPDAGEGADATPA